MHFLSEELRGVACFLISLTWTKVLLHTYLMSGCLRERRNYAFGDQSILGLNNEHMIPLTNSSAEHVFFSRTSA